MAQVNLGHKSFTDQLQERIKHVFRDHRLVGVYANSQRRYCHPPPPRQSLITVEVDGYVITTTFGSRIHKGQGRVMKSSIEASTTGCASSLSPGLRASSRESGSGIPSGAVRSRRALPVAADFGDQQRLVLLVRQK
jgi:hypothetical protein